MDEYVMNPEIYGGLGKANRVILTTRSYQPNLVTGLRNIVLEVPSEPLPNTVITVYWADAILERVKAYVAARKTFFQDHEKSAEGWEKFHHDNSNPSSIMGETFAAMIGILETTSPLHEFRPYDGFFTLIDCQGKPISQISRLYYGHAFCTVLDENALDLEPAGFALALYSAKLEVIEFFEAHLRIAAKQFNWQLEE